MTFPWWAFSGRLWFDGRGYLRYSVNFGDPVTARRVRKSIRFGAVRYGQIVATGKAVPHMLEMAGAPGAVCAEAARYVRLSPAREPEEVLRAARGGLEKAAQRHVTDWFIAADPLKS